MSMRGVANAWEGDVACQFGHFCNVTSLCKLDTEEKEKEDALDLNLPMHAKNLTTAPMDFSMVPYPY